MKIHAFVVSWKGQHDNAAHIAAAIDQDVEALTIVFSDPDPTLAPRSTTQKGPITASSATQAPGSMTAVG